MSKIKLLIHEVFKKAREETGKNTKYGLSTYLWSYFDERIPNGITDKTLSRYYDAFILETRKEIEIDDFTLNRLSEYLGYKDFAEFSRTFIKKNENANKTTIKINVDNDEESISEKFSKLIINITNEQRFKMPEFIKQNGLGIMEIAFVFLLVTGGVIFPNTKSQSEGRINSTKITLWGKPDIEKKYMYWNGERYIATDSSSLGPLVEVVPMNPYVFRYFKKIMRKDTMTLENSSGKVWCSKYNNEVDFFTMDGINPENGKELKLATDHMILKYAGKQTDSMDEKIEEN